MSIQASLRRPIFPTQDRGHVISDSQKNKAPVASMNMDPGIVRPVFRFDDGDGLTDAFGNFYEGYASNSGSHSISITHNPARSV